MKRAFVIAGCFAAFVLLVLALAWLERAIEPHRGWWMP